MAGAVLQRASLTSGQVVTLVVGLGLELLDSHAEGRAFGPIHPVHVYVDDAGRPRLRPVGAPPAWTLHDDWVGLLRFGREMGCQDDDVDLSYWLTGRREGVDLLRWLLDWAPARPLPRVD